MNYDLRIMLPGMNTLIVAYEESPEVTEFTIRDYEEEYGTSCKSVVTTFVVELKKIDVNFEAYTNCRILYLDESMERKYPDGPEDPAFIKDIMEEWKISGETPFYLI